MLEIKVETENWQTHTRISAERLRDLVCRIGGAGDQFLVVQRVPDLPDVFIQVAHEPGGPYEFQHRTGMDAGHLFVTRVPEPGTVADAMIGWARQESGWDAGIEWARLEDPPRTEVPELGPEVRRAVEERVRTLLRCGYLARRELTEAAEEWLVDGDERPVSRPQARLLVDQLWLERLDEQAQWAGPMDPDRLQEAFAALESSGITARENFTCCRGCGLAEIGGSGPADARGFVFFHAQGTEAAADGGGLSLYYGGFDGTAEQTTRIGREVVGALTRAGLSAQWDGSADKAIEITELNWRRRLTG
ncbi:DUF6891 domain-containing protein [Streptomyces sp. NPDC057302]|uniref:DUF6891 domain-containing protein n=1 Tax=Streptomyces sp. NPDC057302 TaxID=3346094 RepID=UPI00363A712C